LLTKNDLLLYKYGTGINHTEVSLSAINNELLHLLLRDDYEDDFPDRPGLDWQQVDQYYEIRDRTLNSFMSLVKKHLSHQQYQVLQLHFIDRHNTREVGESLGVTKHAVQSCIVGRYDKISGTFKGGLLKKLEGLANSHHAAKYRKMLRELDTLRQEIIDNTF
jgi:predicted DNA-binding protein YlxM (UPF0122 family)